MLIMRVTYFGTRFSLPLLIIGLAIATPGFSQNQPPAPNSTEQHSNPALLREAAKAISAGDLQLAEVELRTILETSPRDYRALNFMGIVRAQQKREVEAEGFFKQVRVRRPRIR